MDESTLREHAADYYTTAIRELGGFEHPSQTKVLDFGCGSGQLVGALLHRGFDAYGCDVKRRWSDDDPSTSERLRTISMVPYRLPFEADTFDVVISTSVLEHAQNKEECFLEMHRVLKAGGYSMHSFPGKWYLPRETHINVPLANYFWPNCPKWWLGLWALLGVRNEYQLGKPWKEVLELNDSYCRNGLSYWSTRQYRKLSVGIFGNCAWPMEFYISNARGGYARLCRKLPFKRLTGTLSRELRGAFMIQHKER